MDRITQSNDVVVIPHWVDTSIKGVRNPYDKDFHRKNCEARKAATDALLGGLGVLQMQHIPQQELFAQQQAATLGGQAAQRQGLGDILGGIAGGAGGFFGK